MQKSAFLVDFTLFKKTTPIGRGWRPDSPPFAHSNGASRRRPLRRTVEDAGSYKDESSLKIKEPNAKRSALLYL